MNFTAIDFETANNLRSSACALGVVQVIDGKIVAKKEWLIRPMPFEVGYYQFRVHGLSAQLLEEKPTFDEVWSEIKPFLADTTLVAHNGKFDFGVLQAVMQQYEIPKIRFSTLCSLESAKKIWKGEPGYGLNTLATNKLNHQFNHHNAMEDAEVSALIVLKLAEELNVSSITELMKRINYIAQSMPKKQKKNRF